MRRIPLIVLLLVFCLPVSAWAGAGAVGDGGLVVEGATVKTLTVQGRGLIFGHIDQGTLIVVSYDADDRNPPQISGAPYRLVGDPVLLTVYSGSNITFLFPNGRYSLRLEGTGIDISAVGKGTVTAIGGAAGDGTVAVNGGKPQKLSRSPVIGSFGSGASTPVTTVTSGQTALSKSAP